jgi:hypothetical protein
MIRRERLYGEFIEEASKLFTDALTHQLDEPSKFVRLYALVGNLRLCASADVIVKAEEAMRFIFATYNRPNIDFRNLFVISKIGRRGTPMCFGRLAKLAVKTCAFRCCRVVEFRYRANFRRNSLWR